MLGGQGRLARAARRATRSAVSAPSFFQVNTQVAETLVALVLEDAAARRAGDRVLDLYAGVGTFTLPLADGAGEVVAVEASGLAVRDLRRNLEDARARGRRHAAATRRALWPSSARFDLAVVDPPRSGHAPDALAGLGGSGARRIAYVSCDPATLARDARGACRDRLHGSSPATPVDLFPQTYHVETVAVLDRRRIRRSVPTSGKSVT